MLRKKFNFRLQRILDYRNSLKKDAERALALKNRELFIAEDRLDEILESIDSLPMPGEDLMTMAELRLSGDYQRYLGEALVNQRLLVLEAANAVDEAREAYIEKAVKSESLQTLKNKKIDQHKEEMRKAEKKFLDEITVQRHRFTKGET